MTPELIKAITDFLKRISDFMLFTWLFFVFIFASIFILIHWIGKIEERLTQLARKEKP